MHCFFLAKTMPTADRPIEAGSGEVIRLTDALIRYMRPTLERVECFDPLRGKDCALFEAERWAVVGKRSAWPVQQLFNAWAEVMYSVPPTGSDWFSSMHMQQDDIVNRLRLVASYANIVNYFEGNFLVFGRDDTGPGSFV